MFSVPVPCCPPVWVNRPGVLKPPTVDVVVVRVPAVCSTAPDPADSPIRKKFASAAPPAICAVPELTLAIWERVGTPALQLAGVNQSPTPPFHVVVCAEPTLGTTAVVAPKAAHTTARLEARGIRQPAKAIARMMTPFSGPLRTVSQCSATHDARGGLEMLRAGERSSAPLLCSGVAA